MGNKADIIIIGAGPAGVSAALTARLRGKSVMVIANPPETTALSKAQHIDNYPGAAASGTDMQRAFSKQLAESGALVREGRALSVLPLGKSIGVAVGNDFCEATAVILACGIGRKPLCAGETQFLGRGVSYCATCDGMLYRGKTVAVIGSGSEAAHDAEFLSSIGCDVHKFSGREKLEIRGVQRADTLVVNGESFKTDCIFILSDTITPQSLVSGLELQNGAVKVDRNMRTNIKGVFAAGDLTGAPYQLAKAVGEGNIAALSAVNYIDKGE